MKNILFSALVAFSTLYGAGAVAADTRPSYDNVTLSYQTTDLNFDKTDGAALAFSKTLGDVLFVQGSVSRANNTRTDLDTYRVGVGAKFDFANNASLYALGYGLKANVDYSNLGSSLEFDSWGYGAEGGVRAQVFERLELRGGVATERLTASSNWDTFGLVGATVNVTDSLAVVADARIREDRNQVNLGLQYQF